MLIDLESLTEVAIFGIFNGLLDFACASLFFVSSQFITADLQEEARKTSEGKRLCRHHCRRLDRIW